MKDTKMLSNVFFIVFFWKSQTNKVCSLKKKLIVDVFVASHGHLLLSNATRSKRLVSSSQAKRAINSPTSHAVYLKWKNETLLRRFCEKRMKSKHTRRKNDENGETGKGSGFPQVRCSIFHVFTLLQNQKGWSEEKKIHLARVSSKLRREFLHFPPFSKVKSTKKKTHEKLQQKIPMTWFGVDESKIQATWLKFKDFSTIRRWVLSNTKVEVFI